MPAEDVTITAKWTINQYTITFNTDGGSSIAPITVDYGAAIIAPADPTKEVIHLLDGIKKFQPRCQLRMSLSQHSGQLS
jgi:hypothetical protein